MSQTSVINVAAPLAVNWQNVRHVLMWEQTFMTTNLPVKLARTCPRSSTLYLQGEPCGGIFIVLHGLVALSTGIDSSRQVRVASCRKGSVLGLAETIGGGSYQTTAIAVTDVTTLFVPKGEVLGTIVDDPTTGLHFVQMLTGDLNDLYGRIREIGARY